ncbi:unnamed protein product [Periconia digitata]|uniref:Uncharacterized protein n=1 Tax=Periconia digitata TaxID=1303443 RepID=A0A9W4UWR3_9PLEO|nr:unnamed protein product [Periconia digitata]
MKLAIVASLFAFIGAAFADHGFRASVPELSSQRHLPHKQSRSFLQGRDWTSEYPVASDEIWGKARNRGCSFFQAFGLSDQETAQQLFEPPMNTIASPWRDLGDMISWGFTQTYDIRQNLGPQTEFEAKDSYGYSGWGIGSALRGLNVDDKALCNGGWNVVIQICHGDMLKHARNELSFDEQSIMHGNRRIRATGGNFLFSVNPLHGVLMAMDRLSVHHAAAERHPPVQGSDLPDFNKFSDILFLYWKLHADDFNNRNIRYFLSLGIANRETMGIIKRCFPDVDWDQFPEFPGETFEWHEPEFRALLGSPNSQAFAYFLIQHKADFGNKYITKVQVFASALPDGMVNLCFHVADEPPQGQAFTSNWKEGSGNLSRVKAKANL